jgi:hypothetical protein
MGRAPSACHSPKARALSDKTLIVFLHGIGDSGAQLMPLASSWRASLPNTSFVAPDARMHHRYGLQWFSTEGNPHDPERTESAREAFDGLVKDVVRREGFADAHDRIAFAASRKAPSSRSKPLPPGGGRSAPSWRSPACFPHSWFRPSLPWPRGSRLRSSQQLASKSSRMSNGAPDTRFPPPAPKKRCLF